MALQKTNNRIIFSSIFVYLIGGICDACSRNGGNHNGGHEVFDQANMNITIYDRSTNTFIKQLPLMHDNKNIFIGVNKKDQQQQLHIFGELLMPDEYGRNDGCNVGKRSSIMTWVGIVSHSRCSDKEKTDNVMKHNNASALIICANDSETYSKYDKERISYRHTLEPSTKILTSDTHAYGSPTFNGPRLVDLKATVILLSMEDTKRLMPYLRNDSYQLFIEITPGKSSSEDRYQQINKTSVLFVSISFIVLMIISLAWLIFYYIQRFRYAHAKERLSRRLMSAAKKAINRMPVKTLRNGDIVSDEHDQCAVCIEYYKTSEIVRTLPCHHVFHRSCIDPWLLEQRSCPMCKLDILKAYGLQVLGIKMEPNALDEDSQQDPLGVNIVHFQTTSSSGIAQVELHHASASSENEESERLMSCVVEKRKRQESPISSLSSS